MDLIDGQPTGSVRISFGYMSTVEDAQAFLRFIIAMQLHQSDGQPLPQTMPAEAGAPSESEAQDAIPAIMDGCSSSPQEDAPIASGVCSDLPSTVGAADLHSPLPMTTGTQHTPLERAAGVLDGGLGPYVITNLYLYPIKSCAAFEVRIFTAAQRLLFFVVYFMTFFDKEKSTESKAKCAENQDHIKSIVICEESFSFFLSWFGLTFEHGSA